MQAITALAHIKAVIVFMVDISEFCDHTLEEQFKLFESIQPLFSDKPVFIGLNKVDLLRRTELPQEKEEVLKQFEKIGVSVLELSTLTKEGVIELRDKVSHPL